MRTPQALEAVCLQPQTGRMGLVGLESGCVLLGSGTQEMVFLEPRKKQRTIAGIRELSHGWGICSSELCPSCAIHGLKAWRPLHVWGFDGRQGEGLWGNAQVGYNPCPSLSSSRLSGSISMMLFFIYVLAFTFIY